MRLVAELLIAALLITAAWKKPFGEWFTPEREAVLPAARSRPALRAAAPVHPSGEWMWDKSHHGTLDRPAYDSRDPKSGSGALDRPAYDPRDPQAQNSATPFSR
jgi:hypothetical protein